MSQARHSGPPGLAGEAVEPSIRLLILERDYDRWQRIPSAQFVDTDEVGIAAVDRAGEGVAVLVLKRSPMNPFPQVKGAIVLPRERCDAVNRDAEVTEDPEGPVVVEIAQEFRNVYKVSRFTWACSDNSLPVPFCQTQSWIPAKYSYFAVVGLPPV